MIVCPQCSAENRSGARFCDSCAAALASSAAALQQERKTVTVLFCDVAGSTELGERLDPEALRDATDPDQLGQFFEGLTEPIDHVMVTAGGSYYASIADMDFAQVRRAFDEHLVLPMQVAAAAARKMRPGGTLIFMTGTAARHPAVGSAIAAILAAAVPAITANLALELAPIRGTSSRRASSTHRCQHHSWATISRSDVNSSVKRCLCGESSNRLTSAVSPCT